MFNECRVALLGYFSDDLRTVPALWKLTMASRCHTNNALYESQFTYFCRIKLVGKTELTCMHTRFQR